MSYKSPHTKVEGFGSPVISGALVWTKAKGAKFHLIQLFGGGGAGFPGTVVAPGASAALLGGSGGGYGEIWLPSDVLGATENLNIGAGGVGGAGGTTNFGRWVFVRGGNVNTANSNGAGYPSNLTTALGASWWNSGASAPGISQQVVAGKGGASGGGFTSATVVIAPLAGGDGSVQVVASTPGAGSTGMFTPAAGGLAGTVGTPNGGNGNPSAPVGALGIYPPLGGTGGGGGLSQIAGNGGNGGNGGFPAGGGGSGGKAFTGFTAGLAGNGANGYILVTTFF